MGLDSLIPRADEAVAWVLASDEPPARWVVRAGVLSDQEGAAIERERVRVDPGVRGIVTRLGDWTAGVRASGHHSPAYAPNVLALLADLGLGPGDDPAVETLLDTLLDHRLPDGRFAAGAPQPTGQVAWGSLLCDTHAITDVLLRFGRGADPRVKRALALMIEDRGPAPGGPAWPCRPDPTSGFRGPGRRGDLCPQATLEAVRAWSRLPASERPPAAVAAARELLAVWRSRGEAKPYMFGHGIRFKVVKWPTTWYGALTVLDGLGGYPELWSDPGSDDRRSLAELMACVVAYNVAADGRVTPLSCFRGFEEYSFGRKDAPSPFATARVYQVLHAYAALASEAAAVDVGRLGSSKGGTGTPRPPARAGAATGPRRD